MTPQPARPARPSRLLPGEKTFLKVCGWLLAAGVIFYAGYLAGGAQFTVLVPESEGPDCAAIKKEVENHLDEGLRAARLVNDNSDGSYDYRMAAHLMLNHPQCHDATDIAFAQTLLDTWGKTP